MKWLRDLSIRAKLNLIVLSICGSSLALAGGTFFFYDFLSSRANLLQRVRITAGIIGSGSSAAVAFEDRRAAGEVLQALGAAPMVERAALYDRDGLLVASYTRGDLGADLPAPRPPLLGDVFESDRLRVVRAVELDGNPIGTVVLEASLAELEWRARQYLWAVLGILGMSVLLAFVLSSRMQRWISERIVRLASLARHVSKERDYSVRAEEQASRDEVGLLVDGFNAMLEQIHSRDDELTRHRDHLEEEVGARTVELTRLNEQLRQARDRAEAGARAKSIFLANMSHEIRTPMNGILGMSELLSHSQLSREQQDCLTRLRDSATALLSVLDDVLDFSKIEAGKLTLHRERFSLRSCVEAAAGAIALRSDEKGLELICDIGSSAPDALVGDPGRLRQVLVNLLSNAVKFTELGEVLLTVRLEGEEYPRLELRFTVSDTGIGVPEELHERIFTPFEQADGTSTRKHGGTGLGLSIASQLVSLMGGRIWLESQVGRGSSFHFTAAFELDDSLPWQPGQERTAGLRGVPVLLVDDSARCREVISEMLRGWSMEVAEAASAPAALDELGRARDSGAAFPLVLADARMPGMDAFELADEIARQPGLAGSVIVMLPAMGRLQMLGDRDRLGVAAFVNKPIRRTELCETLRETLRGPAGRSEPEPATPAIFATPPSRSLAILLAEDNPVNQRLATVVLERRGHSVHVAGDGEAALQELERRHFDLVLMDLSMPRMGGIEATAAIRARERFSDRHVPIVAMTAHALRGDRERCLSAGMDGYVAKPVDIGVLIREVERFFDGPAERGVTEGTSKEEGETRPEDSGNGAQLPPHSSPLASPFPSPGQPFDLPSWRRLLRDRFGDDPSTLERVIAVFLESSPRLLTEIERAIEAGDIEALAVSAHALKGSVGLFEFKPARAEAEAMELAAREGRLGMARASIERLKESVETTRQLLASLQKG